MSKIAILTDSSCDIPQEMAEKYGIDIMSFHILLDDVDYVERESCTNTEFYDKMRAAKGVPSTAAITPIQFCEKYCQYVDEGYTDVIHVPINKSGSSTYNNALMAQGMLREERPEHHLKIHLLDPHTYSMVFGWYLCEMARKLKNGAEISHVIREFEKQMDCMEIVLGPYSLKQMKKSGRISAAAAVMGELMGIRPIITLIDGKTKVEAKQDLSAQDHNGQAAQPAGIGRDLSRFPFHDPEGAGKAAIHWFDLYDTGRWYLYQQKGTGASYGLQFPYRSAL